MNNNGNDNAAGPAGDVPEAMLAAQQAAAAPPDGAIRVRPLAFRIAVPDIRNGALADIQQAAPKSAMSALYNWVVITHLPAGSHIDAVEHVIRGTYAQMAHALGGALDPAREAEFRKKAIVAGAVRAGAAAAYRLAAGDMTRSEVVPSGMEYTAGSIHMAGAGGTANGRWALARGLADLTATEQGVVAACVYMGMAVPVLQGVSLVMTGHHYIPPTYNLFTGIKKQALGSALAEVRTWVEAMGEAFDDVAFHKACHPVSPTLKRSMSKSVDVMQRLKASGHGSAAIRLPAVPSEASGGKAAIGMLRAASSTITSMGHTVSWNTGEALLHALEHSAEGAPEAEACDAVVKWIADHGEQLAFCAGIVQHIHDTTGSAKNTLLAAFSVKRIMAENPNAVSRGVIYARAAAARFRAALETGTAADVNMVL